MLPSLIRGGGGGAGIFNYFAGRVSRAASSLGQHQVQQLSLSLAMTSTTETSPLIPDNKEVPVLYTTETVSDTGEERPAKNPALGWVFAILAGLCFTSW